MMSAPTLLIPIRFPNPDPLPSSFVSGLTSCEVTLLGLYETPSETAADERNRRSIEANYHLYSLAHQFIQHGAGANVELVMDEDLEGRATAIAEERDLDAVLAPNPITNLGRVLIAVRDETFVDPVERFVATLDEDVVQHLTLVSVTETDRVKTKEDLLSGLRDRLTDAGFSRFAVDTDVIVSDDAPFAISQAAQNHDLIVMGETEQDGRERVFGKTYDLIADSTHHPVVVLRE